ncbi:translesion error-prone DNA polymerase V subunit UmuC [Pantoea sp. EKM101V]|uniref:translesion error-prone DNA polymerase V subunit UmuC n=1 Tax=Pantoea sp. EKM101V TaxID=1683695 RepID=UPI00142D2632|nr:translesion error-prone DNA polymerase V subunit UmuC [Pantoea sp. EKM101V]KAF6669168.1 translesion error-prone DNA polymerase V subunit UmuC [Pantoea sp. EKM101V]
MFALVDVNCFYASCETVFRPDLKGKPVVVLSNNDGCVIARSAEAKKLGIKMGAPYFKMREELMRHAVQVFSSNYALYADMSHRVMTILEEMAPSVEIYSVDEAFMDLTGVQNAVALETFGQQVRERIRKETHLTVGVGIAPTKTLAKLANFAAKKWTKTGGIVDLSNPERQRKLLALINVADVWGVGHRISKRLNAMGVMTAKDLAEQSTDLIRRQFSVVMERTVRELRGESCLDLEPDEPDKQQIMCSRSFGYRISDYHQMREAVCAYAERAAEKLRREKQYCRQVGVFVRTSPHAADEPFYGNQSTAQLLIPTHDTRDIIRVAMACLDNIWIEGHRYMKAGIVLTDFFSQGVAQLDLFDEHQPRRNSEELMQLIDRINTRGSGKLWFAGQGVNKAWAMKRDMLSPAYTTRVTDLPVAALK